MGTISCFKCGRQIKSEEGAKLVIEKLEIELKAMCSDCLKKFFEEVMKPKELKEAIQLMRPRGSYPHHDIHSYLVGLLPVVKGKKSLENLKSLIEKYTNMKVGPDIIEWKKWFEEEGHGQAHAFADRRIKFFSVVRILGMPKDEKQQKEIAEILEKCTGQKFGTDADKWEEWMDDNPDEITEEVDRILTREGSKVKGLWFG